MQGGVGGKPLIPRGVCRVRAALLAVRQAARCHHAHRCRQPLLGPMMCPALGPPTLAGRLGGWLAPRSLTSCPWAPTGYCCSRQYEAECCRQVAGQQWPALKAAVELYCHLQQLCCAVGCSCLWRFSQVVSACGGHAVLCAAGRWHRAGARWLLGHETKNVRACRFLQGCWRTSTGRPRMLSKIYSPFWWAQLRCLN